MSDNPNPWGAPQNQPPSQEPWGQQPSQAPAPGQGGPWSSPPPAGQGQPGYPPQQGQPAPGGYPPAGAQPPGYPQGAAGYAPPGQFAAPPKKSKKPWLIGCGSLAFVGLLAFGGCAYFVYNTAKGPVDKANEFMGLLDDGDYDDAFDLIPRECRDNTFDNDIRDARERDLAGALNGFNLNIEELNNNNGDESAVVGGTSRLDGSNVSTRIELVKNGDWEICSYRIGQ